MCGEFLLEEMYEEREENLEILEVMREHAAEELRKGKSKAEQAGHTKHKQHLAALFKEGNSSDCKWHVP